MDLENPSVRNGVIAGLGAVAIGLVFYLMSARAFFGYSGWISTILIIVFMVRSVKEEKATAEYLPFNGALKPAFVTFLVANLIGTIFYYVLLNFIDPGLIQIQKEIALEAIEKMGGLLGEDMMEQSIDALEARDFTYGITTAAWGFAWQLIFPGFIVSAIIAAIMKDRKPVEH